MASRPSLKVYQPLYCVVSAPMYTRRGENVRLQLHLNPVQVEKRIVGGD